MNDDNENAVTDPEQGTDSGGQDPEQAESLPMTPVEIGTYFNAVEVVYTSSGYNQRTALLRSFAVEESDLTAQASLMRRIVGKSLIAGPDGTFQFICHLNDVDSITVRRNVTISYTYE